MNIFQDSGDESNAHFFIFSSQTTNIFRPNRNKKKRKNEKEKMNEIACGSCGSPWLCNSVIRIHFTYEMKPTYDGENSLIS